MISSSMTAIIGILLLLLDTSVYCVTTETKLSDYPLENVRRPTDAIYNAVRAELCQSTTSKECEGICCPSKDVETLNNNETLVKLQLLCKSESHLTIGWTLLTNATTKIIYVNEIVKVTQPEVLEYQTFILSNGSNVSFKNLTDSTDYYVCISTINVMGQIGKISCETYTTLIKGYTPGTVSLIWLDSLVYNESHGFEASIKWSPAEDHACFYYVGVWTNAEFFMELEAELPTNVYNATLFDLEYMKNYTVTVISKNYLKNKESNNSWFTFMTPSCLETHNSLKLCPPLMPTNVTVLEEISKKPLLSIDNLHPYDITVQWKSPEFVPDYYLINLTNTNRAVISTGNITGVETKAIFEGIDIGTSYTISIIASSKGGISKPAFIYREFKQHKLDNSTTGNLLWGILTPILAFFVIISLAALIYHRHEKLKLYKRRCRYFEELEQKAPKEIDSSSNFPINPIDDPFEIVPDKLILYEILGEGAFGIVRKGWIPDQNREVAVKMMKDEPSAEEVKQFKQEIDMMKAVGFHAHIVSLVGCCTRPTATMMLVVEFCSLGDLQNYLRKIWNAISLNSTDKTNNCEFNLSNSNIFGEDQIKYADMLISGSAESPPAQQPNFIANKLYDLEQTVEKNMEGIDIDLTSIDLLSFARQIAMGMEFLSLNRVVHRDLAARNVLVSSDKTVKIADFGLSRDIYQENIYRKIGAGKLPIKWMALESLTHQVYTTQSDVWSYGILLWEIITLGGNPYPGVPSNKFLKLLMSGYRMECPQNCSSELYSLMMGCWQSRPKDRPTFTDIKQKIDWLLDGICSHKYLTLDIIDYSELSDLKQLSRKNRSKYNSNGSNIEKSTSYERYVRPISLNRRKLDNSGKLLNQYGNQPVTKIDVNDQVENRELIISSYSLTNRYVKDELINESNLTLSNCNNVSVNNYCPMPKSKSDSRIVDY